MSKNARKWEEWEDNIILTSKASIQTLTEVINRSYDAIASRRTVLRRRYDLTSEEIGDVQEHVVKIKNKSITLSQEFLQLTEGMSFTPQSLYILATAYKQGFDITDLLNPDYETSQIKELFLCLKEGIDISWMNGHNAKQIVEIRLGKMHGIDTSWYEDPRYDFNCMRQLRYGLEAKLPVQVYASFDYTSGHMNVLRDCLRNRIPTETIKNPKYSVFRMKIMRSAVKAGLDTTTFEDPDIPDSRAKEMYKNLSEKFRAVYPTLSKIPKLEHFSLQNLHDAGEPFVVHCGWHDLAKEFLNEMKDLGYSWDKINNVSRLLGGLCFYCNPKEKTLYANQNKPKGDCFVSYASIKYKQSPLRRDDWVSCEEELPPQSGMFLCMVRNENTGETKERFIEFDRQRRFRVEGTVLSWKPHFTREELSTYKKNYPEEDVFPAQTFFAMQT